MEEFIRKMNPKNIRRTIIHSHYNLIGKYNLKGIHLPEKVRTEEGIKEVIRAAKKKKLSVSTSVHSLTSLKECNQYDYVFLSPVFDSISKEGYKATISLTEFSDLRKELKSQVIALGGIDESTILKIKETGFDGAALHGVIWESANEAAANFSKIHSKLIVYS
jgi:thiamine-phosphate pyrophosphorylase